MLYAMYELMKQSMQKITGSEYTSGARKIFFEFTPSITSENIFLVRALQSPSYKSTGTYIQNLYSPAFQTSDFLY